MAAEEPSEESAKEPSREKDLQGNLSDEMLPLQHSSWQPDEEHLAERQNNTSVCDGHGPISTRTRIRPEPILKPVQELTKTMATST